jgi:hypothetical protein
MLKSRDGGSVGSVCDRLFSRGSQTPPYTRKETFLHRGERVPSPLACPSRENYWRSPTLLPVPILAGLRRLNPARRSSSRYFVQEFHRSAEVWNHD